MQALRAGRGGINRAELDARQLAAYREAQARGYLHLRYRDQRESLDAHVYGPLVRVWEAERHAADAALIAVESYADSKLAEVTYAALASPRRTELDPARARAAAALERLVGPMLGALDGDQSYPVQLCWFSRPLSLVEAEALASCAVAIDRWLVEGGER